MFLLHNHSHYVIVLRWLSCLTFIRRISFILLLSALKTEEN